MAGKLSSAKVSDAGLLADHADECQLSGDIGDSVDGETQAFSGSFVEPTFFGTVVSTKVLNPARKVETSWVM